MTNRTTKLTVTLNKMLVVIAAALMATVGTIGCGGTDTATETAADQRLQSKPLDLLLPDCSGSFKAKLPGFTDTFTAITMDSAARGRRLWMACFEGSLLRSARFEKVDFGQLPESVGGNEKLAARFTQARAHGMVKKVEKAIATSESEVSGSGQLEALEVAAKTPEVGRVFLVTDLISYEVDGIDLATASAVDVKEAVKRWLPRLGSGLSGVQVFVVGVGLGAGSSTAVRNAKTLFTHLITEGGGKVSITQELPASLVLDRGGS